MAKAKDNPGRPGARTNKPGGKAGKGGWRNQKLPAEKPRSPGRGRKAEKSGAVDASPAEGLARDSSKTTNAAGGRHRNPQADRDERRRQGSLAALAGRKETVAAETALAESTLPDKPLLMTGAHPGLEQRVHAWLDVLVYAWRRRKIGPRARFIRNAHLKEDEIAVLGPAVQQLSRGFTGHRTLVGKTYLDDPDLLGAYLLFYWPVSYAQAWTVLSDQERRHGLPELKRIADLGCGPGPLACALLDKAIEQAEMRESEAPASGTAGSAGMVGKSGSIPSAALVEILAMDHSPQALKLLEELVRFAHGPGSAKRFRLTTREWDGSKAAGVQAGSAAKPLLEGGFECVATGHFLNELWNDLAPALAESRRAGLLRGAAASLRSKAGGAAAFLMILEPALKPTTRSLLAVRDQLADAGLPILGPCFYQGACPALASPEGTCHGQVFWELPGLIRQLAKVAHLSKEELAMAWLTVGAPGPGVVPEPPQVARNDRPAPAKGEGRDRGPAGGEGLPPPNPNEGIWRVVGEAMLNKAGRTRYMICGANGRTSLSLKQGELVSQAAEGKARNRAQATEDIFFALRRGDAIRLKGAVERDSGYGVAPETRIEPL